MVWSAEELGLGVLMLGAAANAPRHPSDPGTLGRLGQAGRTPLWLRANGSAQTRLRRPPGRCQPKRRHRFALPRPYGGIFLSNPGEPSPQTIGRHSGPVTPSIQLRLRAFAPLG